MGKKCENSIKLSGQRFFKVREEVAAAPARKENYLAREGREGFARERNWRVAAQHSSLFKRGPMPARARRDAPKVSLY